MNGSKSFEEFQEIVKKVVALKSDDFFEIAKVTGLDPKSDFVGADLSGVDISHHDLSGANFSGTDLRDANLRGTNLSEANLRGIDLSGADLSGASLFHVNPLKIGGMDISDFRKSVTLPDLLKIVLEHEAFANDMEIQSKQSFRAIGANFVEADLKQARLPFAYFSNADMSKADLRGANLNQATLHGAKFDGAQVSEAIFLGSKGLSQSDIEDLKSRGAIFDLADINVPALVPS
ncbi:pentapeptide repeat protein [Thalassoporum mexicanum PCC 7367]|uniref:pentapeptide repeat-containing protein n=1 Tax=Thalassoporum mexicanum TaxID=3457544 RepID=UPI00029FB0B4|nr:pentapeptide repeat-containing protein [Pseudanabaena sp. PCC 7367]AFY68797.1 pentapeptide repeat protein [Pseudanabaena sp. PCC 7367]